MRGFDTSFHNNIVDKCLYAISHTVDFSIIGSDGKVLSNESQFREAGNHNIELSSDDFTGPGIYHYTITSAGNNITKRFLLIK